MLLATALTVDFRLLTAQDFELLVQLDAAAIAALGGLVVVLVVLVVVVVVDGRVVVGPCRFLLSAVVTVVVGLAVTVIVWVVVTVIVAVLVSVVVIVVVVVVVSVRGASVTVTVAAGAVTLFGSFR
jgi:hypothetical protein